MLEVASAEYVEDYKIHLVFNNGEEGIVDLKDCLWGPMFEPLKVIDEFKQFSVSEILHTLCWKNDADFAPEFLYERMLESAHTTNAAASRR